MARTYNYRVTKVEYHVAHQERTKAPLYTLHVWTTMETYDDNSINMYGETPALVARYCQRMDMSNAAPDWARYEHYNMNPADGSTTLHACIPAPERMAFVYGKNSAAPPRYERTWSVTPISLGQLVTRLHELAKLEIDQEGGGVPLQGVEKVDKVIPALISHLTGRDDLAEIQSMIDAGIPIDDIIA